MNKKEIYDFLNENKTQYEVTEHKAVFNMEELSEIDIPYPEGVSQILCKVQICG